MRRLILFLVLFALGLGLLLWLTRREREDAQKREQQTTQAPPVPEHFTQLPADKGQGQTGLNLHGRLSLKKRAGTGGTLRTEYELEAGNVDFLEGDAYDMRELVLRIFDPLSGRERAHMTSPRTRATLALTDDKPALAPGEPVRLNNVELVLEEGAPIVPLTLRMPLLEWTPSSGQLSSSDRVVLEGQGLTAEGSGLDASILREDLRLLRDGSVELALENGARATLRATGSGPFEIRRLEPPEPAPGAERAAAAIEVRVREGARLDLRDPQRPPLEISSRELTLRGVQRHGGAQAFVLLDAVASGAVHAEGRGDSFDADSARWDFDGEGRLIESHLEGAVVLGNALGTFRARSAGFRFGADGQLARAELDGEPSGLLELDRAQRKLPQELAGARARVSGAGPLVLDYSAGAKVDFAGPARLEIPETQFEIDARGRLSGNVDAEARTGHLLAEGGAHCGWGGSELSAPIVDVHYALGTPRGDVVGARAEGDTHANIVLPGREPFQIDAAEGLEARSIGGKLTLPLARGVKLERQGAHSFLARAASVRDFDPELQSFLAEGAVHVEDARGSGDAERVVAAGAHEHTFFGTAREPARWRLLARGGQDELGSAQAVEIRVHETSLEALGAVEAGVEARDGRYGLRCEELELVRTPEPGVDPAQWRGFSAHALRDVHLSTSSALRGIELASDDLFLTGRFRALPRAGVEPELEAGTLDARGSVVVDWKQAGELHGEGERFELDDRGRGTLSTHPGARVHARGALPGRVQPYQLDADWIAYGEQRLEAQHAALALLESQGSAQAAERPSALLIELSTDRLVADARSLHLDGQAHALGRTRSGESWSLDAADLLLQGDFARRGSVEETLSLARAQGGVHVQIGEQLDLSGDVLEGQPARLRIEGHPATLQLADSLWESPWIEYDPVNMLLATGRGTLRARDQRDKQAWSIEYESLQPFDQEDTTILVLHNPLFRQERKELRATWALFWVDREEWRHNTRGAIGRRIQGAELRARAPEPPAERRPSRDLQQRFQELRNDPLARILSEVYVEGEVELVEHDPEDPRHSQRRARAKAFYLDLRQGMGWLQEADLVLPLPFRAHGLPENIRAKANWMRVGSDFSLSADDAVITSCEYDEPHYMIETSRLRITPTGAGKQGWNFEARDNALRFGRGGLTIPLPTIDTPTDEHGNPSFITDFIAGNSSRFGASVRATINLALGSLGFGIGRFFGGILDVPTADLDGHWKFDVGVLGTRGLLLGAGLEFAIPRQLRFEVDYSIIPDNQSDRGLVRVPEEDRTLLRQWFRLRGRRFFGPTEWVDLAYSWESDPGVQSEFFERDYLYYEQRDDYAHWRKATGSTFWSASARVRSGNRTDVEELPKLGWYLGRHPVWRIGRTEVLYTAQASAGYYQRREGDTTYYPPFPDGGGDRDILRADTEHRLEAPFALGFAGARATPFVSARGTAWSASQDGYEDATRGVLSAGVETSTSFWRRYPGGTLSTITPRVAVHGDVADENGGPPPLAIDGVEDDLSGTWLDLGLRARWWQPRTKEHLDLDLAASHGWNMDTSPDGWRPLGVLGEFLTFVDRVPVGLTHDARYSLEDRGTVYSRSFLGFRPLPQWGVELGFHHALDPGGDRLYEAATINTRYHATQKWELELSETLDLDRGGGLDHEFTLRRLGHDFVMELGVNFRAGEGTGFGIKLVPNLAYRRSGLGLIDRWLGQDE